MSASLSTHSVPGGLPVGWGQRALELIARGVSSLAHEVRIRRDLRRLSGLDDAILHDIGVARGGLEGAVRFGRTTERLARPPTMRMDRA